jgi:hypothetical protein
MVAISGGFKSAVQRVRWRALFSQLVGAAFELRAAREGCQFANPAGLTEAARALYAWEKEVADSGTSAPLAGLSPAEASLYLSAVHYAQLRETRDGARQWEALLALIDCCVALPLR